MSLISLIRVELKNIAMYVLMLVTSPPLSYTYRSLYYILQYQSGCHVDSQMVLQLGGKIEE